VSDAAAEPAEANDMDVEKEGSNSNSTIKNSNSTKNSKHLYADVTKHSKVVKIENIIRKKAIFIRRPDVHVPTHLVKAPAAKKQKKR
jgi:hypothetical protein